MQERIYHELVVGTFADSTQEFCLEVIESLVQQKAEAVILGCTELPLLLEEVSCPIPLIDSLQCHCEAITQFCIKRKLFTAHQIPSAYAQWPLQPAPLVLQS